jgi:hypothetical protein
VSVLEAVLNQKNIFRKHTAISVDVLREQTIPKNTFGEFSTSSSILDNSL